MDDKWKYSIFEISHPMTGEYVFCGWHKDVILGSDWAVMTAKASEARKHGHRSQWRLFDAGNKNIVIANLANGNFATEFSRIPNSWVFVCHMDEDYGSNGQMLQLIDRGDGKVSIRHMTERNRTEVWMTKPLYHNRPRAPVWVGRWNYEGLRDKQEGHYRFEQLGEVNKPRLREGEIEPGAIAPPPKLVSLTLPPPRTPAVLIGETLIPYYLVDDTLFGGNRGEQIRNSPYYILRRENFWLHYRNRTYSGHNSFKYELKKTWGVKETTSTSFESTTTISLSGDFKFVLKKINTLLKSSLTQELKVSTSNEISQNWEKEETEMVEFSGNKPDKSTLYVFDQLVDRYSLWRMGAKPDDSPVQVWELFPDSFHQRSHRET